MKMKRLLIGSAATAMLFCGGVSANEIEANIALSTDYVFRGFSQTEEDPAISGGLDYSFDGGVYFGTWASNVDFGEDYDTSIEIDLYAGYEFDLSDTASLDLSALYYIYPGETGELNYSEYIATADIGNASFGVAYSPDYFGADTDAVVLEAGYSLGLTEVLSLDFHVGYTEVDDVDELDFDGKDDYVDYSIGLSAPLGGVDLSLVAYGTDVDNVDVADERIVFAIAKTF